MGTRSLQGTKVTLSMTTQVRNAMITDDTIIAQGPVAFNIADSLDSNASVGGANRAWEWVSTINSGATLTFDLFDLVGFNQGAGGGDDMLGQAISPFEEIVCILIKNVNAEGVAGNLEVEPDPVAGWTPMGSHTVALGGALGAQGAIVKYNPSEGAFDVNDGVSHRIRLTANGGNIAIKVALLARHDDDESSSSSSSVSSSSSSASSSSSSVSSVSSSSSSSISSSSESSSSSISSSSVSSSSVSSSSSSVSSISSSSISSSSSSASVVSSSSSSNSSSASI